MPRKKLVSDSEVLDGALRVILRHGPHGFTLSQVAEEIGLSRAALIQRFTDKANLHLCVMERATQEVRDYFAAAGRETGLAPLWAMLTDLIGGMGDGEGFAGHVLISWADLVDARLNRLARERNRLVHEAIAGRLPAVDGRVEKARLIQQVIQGATMRWLVEPIGPLNTYVTDETRAVLELMFPEHRFG